MPSYEEYVKNKRKKKQDNGKKQDTGKNLSYEEWARAKRDRSTTLDLPTKDSGKGFDSVKASFGNVFEPVVDVFKNDAVRKGVNILFGAQQYKTIKDKYGDVAFAGQNQNEATGGLFIPASERLKGTLVGGTEEKWFQSGYFEDGYDFGDVTKTILDTSVDVGENLVTGIIELPEQIIDASVSGSTALGDYIWGKLPDVNLPLNEVFDEKALEKIQKATGVDFSTVDSFHDLKNVLAARGENFVAEDLYNGQEFSETIITNPYENLTGHEVDEGSVLGEKSDSLVQSLGQVLATRGMGKFANIPWQAITGTTAFGSQAEKALNEGADIREATNSATISAMAEVAFEMLGGYTYGSTNKTLSDVLTKPVLESISNTFAKKVVEYGFDVGSESIEEVLTEFVSKIGEKAYRDESFKEILLSEEALNDYLDAAIGGALLGVVTGGGNHSESDSLTKNEQAVVDKAVNDKVAEKEANGEKVSAKEKAKIRQQVMSELDKGYISIEDIESTLGGDTYKAYKDIVDSEDALQKEFDELGGKTNPTLAETSRYNELKQQLEDIKNNSKRNELKDRLSDEVFNLVKDSRLNESYNEKTRKSQSFEADVSQYDTKQQAIVQKAIDSGILNNTNRTHEFVDLIAKISADKGIDFDFADNAKLKETGFVLEGKQINGVVTGDGNVILNIESHKALESVVGHEVAHVFEGTEMYDVFADSIIKYAQAKGEYQTRLDAISKLYEGVYKGNDFEGDVRKELVADLVGDYLFTDSDFINTLCTEKPKLFKKIFDEIKYLCKVATGSKEARELERVKRAFDEAYKESAIDKNSQTQYNLSRKNDYGDNINNFYRALNKEQWRDFYQQIADNGYLEYTDVGDIATVVIGNKLIVAERQMTGKDAHDFQVNDAYELVGTEDYDVLYDVQNELERRSILDGDKLTTDAIFGLFRDASQEGTLLRFNTNKLLFDNDFAEGQKSHNGTEINGIPETKSNGQSVSVGNEQNIQGTKADLNKSAFSNAQKKYSLSSDIAPVRSDIQDSNGRILSTEQREYFRLAKTRDTEGRLKPYYHGSHESFTVFDKKKARSGGTYGTGFYFTDSESHAGTYGDTYDVYLNITNPLQNGTDDITKDQLRKFVEAIAEDEDYGIENYGYEATIDSVTDSVYGKSDFAMLMDLNISCIGNMVEAVELFNKVNGTDYDGIVAPTETVAFYPNQIKNVDNINPTDNDDIRYSLSEEDDLPTRGHNGTYGEDIRLVKTDDIAPAMGSEKAYISFEDFANRESPLWNNVDYNDDVTKSKIMRDTHKSMVDEGSIVVISDDVKNKVAEAYPDLRSMKKEERRPILREAMHKAKKELRTFLNGLRNQKFEFDVNGQVLEAKIYSTGINEVLEKITKEKSEMAYSTEDIFRNVRYLYSTNDYGEDSNVYRWNYFYTPVKIDGNIVGVRIAVRDLIKQGQSQIYHWGIKKDTSLDGVRDDSRNRKSHDVSSDVSNNIISHNKEFVNGEGESPIEQGTTRRDLHQSKIDNIKRKFTEKGFDFDKVLRGAKNLSTFATVDNTPQRVMEKSLGYKAGQILADETINKVAQAETEGIKWLNSYTDRKNGILAQISKEYHIKPGSKKSAAAQMFAEGFYVDENNNIIEYGEAELKADFPDAEVRENIKALARDPRIRQIYDETLAMINESRVRNAYPEIQRLENYFLHFRAMEDTFSRLGLPFNPNDIRAKDLPTDLNGVTADLKPGQPYFASTKHRLGKRTSFDLLGGLERYLTSAKNQIYHIDDIQTLRALRNYIADTYGQAKGLEGLDTLTEEEAQERIKQVYDSHLSTFAKFLNEEANILAGKTSLIDRGLEGVIGRRGITFLDTVNKQVGSNMVGLNLSSSLTNILPVVQTFAKSNKFDFTKAFAQFAANKVSGIFGKNDGFTENSSVIIRRKGADKFYRTPFQKVGDVGYIFMSAVDDVATEVIARTKYNELTRKGADSRQAHYETDKWVSRLMGDRSLGQMPQLYNSKMLGLVTKFQLEVRNQLDSQFYDTIQEAKVSNEYIENALARNAKTAAKVTSTFVQLAVAQHVFGVVFESIAGYNPAFDIIEVLMKTLGLDDDEESEDTPLDNIEQGFFALLEDLPYSSVFTGGRIPISAALPIKELVKGEDEYGNEKSRWETFKEAVPHYLLPGGYGQIEKTIEGLSMFDDDLPVSGSYTDNGDLRFPVEDTPLNKVQAAIFGQWSSKNARDYFDNNRQPLKEQQIEEFVDLDLPIAEYWEIREGLKECDDLEDKFDYIADLDLPVRKKNILINNIVDRDEELDMVNYDDFNSYEEFDFATKYPEKYEFFNSVGLSVEDYNDLDEDGKRAYTWAYDNPEKYVVSQAVTDDVVEYKRYTKALSNIKADYDRNGNPISGSKKEKVIDYINSLDIEYGQAIILFKMQYKSDDTYNKDIVDYLNGRDDISREDMITILEELGATIDSRGQVWW